MPAPDFRLGVYVVLHIDTQARVSCHLTSPAGFYSEFLIEFFKIICYNIFVGAGFPVGCLCGLAHRYSGEGKWGLALSAGFYSEFLIDFFLEKQAELGFHS